MNKRTINLLQKFDLNKKVENFKLKKNNKKNLKPCIKKDKNSIKFDDTEIEKYNFHQHKIPFWINSVHIHRIVVSSEVSLGERGF